MSLHRYIFRSKGIINVSFFDKTLGTQVIISIWIYHHIRTIGLFQVRQFMKLFIFYFYQLSCLFCMFHGISHHDGQNISYRDHPVYSQYILILLVFTHKNVSWYVLVCNNTGYAWCLFRLRSVNIFNPCKCIFGTYAVCVLHVFHLQVICKNGFTIYFFVCFYSLLAFCYGMKYHCGSLFHFDNRVIGNLIDNLVMRKRRSLWFSPRLHLCCSLY